MAAVSLWVRKANIAFTAQEYALQYLPAGDSLGLAGASRDSAAAGLTPPDDSDRSDRGTSTTGLQTRVDSVI